MPLIDEVTKSLIIEAAHRHGLRPALVGAVVLTESTEDVLTWSGRYEAHFPVTRPSQLRPKYCSIATEKIWQKCSWGLMHVMGGTARDMGFKGWLSELCQPEIGLEYGCKYLAKQMARYHGNVELAVAAYNAGSAKIVKSGKPFNYESYVVPVMRRVAMLEQEGWG